MSSNILHPPLLVTKKVNERSGECVIYYNPKIKCTECNTMGAYQIPNNLNAVSLCLRNLIYEYGIEDIFVVDDVHSNSCPVIFGIYEEDLNHKTVMTPAYYEKSEDARDLIDDNDSLTEEYIDEVEEYRFGNQIAYRKGCHIRTCPHPKCKQLLNTWKNEPSLSQYLKKEEKY